MAGLGGSSGGATGAIRAGRAYVEAFLDSNKLDRGLKALRSKFAALGSSLQNIGLKSIMGGAGLAAPLALATNTFIGFDDAIRAAKAAVGASNEEFARLEQLARQLGRTTSYTATDVAALMVELGRAGFSVPQIERMTEAVLNLARATGITAPEAAAIMSATIRQFKLDASQAAQVADLLTKTANASFTSVQGIGETLNYAGPVAADLGLTLGDTLALVGALGNVGIQGSEAGTALRRLGIIAAAEPEKFAAIGVATKDAGGNLRDLVDILDDVFKATKDMGNADRAKVFNDIFGLLGITSASALSSNIRGVRELRDEIAKSGGVAAATAREMDAGIGGAWRRFKSSVEAVAIAIGEALAPVLMEIGGWLGFVASTVVLFINRNREVVTTVGKVAVALVAGGAALVALGLLAKVAAVGLGGLLAVLGLVKAAVLFLLSPVGLVTAAVVGLVAAWATMTESGRRTVSELKTLFADLGRTAAQTWTGVVDALKAGNLQLAGEVATAGLKLAWAEAMEFMTRKWVEFRRSFLSGWAQASNSFADILLMWRLGVERILHGHDAANRLAEELGHEWREMIEHENRENNRAGQDQIDRARQAVEEARRKLREATDRAAQERAAAELQARQEEQRRVEEQRRNGMSHGMAAPMQVAAAVAGGFSSPALASRLGYSSETFQKKQLAATEGIEKNTREIVDAALRIGDQLRFW